MSISHFKSRMRYHLWGYLFLLLYGLVLFWPIPFADVTIASGDILQQFYPWTQFWVNEYQTNGYPYWNPYTYGGTPFLGNLQVTPFYPPGFLLPLLSPLKFFGWTLLFHTVFAGIAMYLLIYHLVKDRFSATAMGLIYLSSGFLITRISDGHITIMNGLPWLPLVLLAYLRWSERQSWGRWGFLTFMIAFQLLGGQPQIPYLTLLFAGLLSLRDSFWIYRKGERSIDVVLRPVGALIFASILAVLLTAPVWLPFLEFNQLSAIRSSGTDFIYASKDSLPFHHLFTLLMPFFVWRSG